MGDSPTVTTVTLAQVNDAIATTLGAAAGMQRTQSYDDLTEGVHDQATVQVYLEEWNTDVATSNDRTTFKRGVAQTQAVFHADVFARQRSNIGDDMAALMPLIDATITKLEAQKEPPFFGQAGIKSFSWLGRRVVFQYGNVQFAGARFIITVRLF